MVDINFENTITINNFNFGEDGTPTNLTFSLDDVVDSTYDFEFGDGKGAIYNIFTGSSNTFNSIWCDPTASLTNGKFYVTRQDDLSIVARGEVKDYYSQTKQGASMDTLNSSDIVDMQVSF